MDQFKRFVRTIEKKELLEAEMRNILSNMEKADLAANAKLLRAHAKDSKELGKLFIKLARTKVPAKRGRPLGSKNKPEVEIEVVKKAKPASKKPVSKKKPTSKKKPVSKKLASKKPVSKKPVSKKKPTSKNPIRRIAPVSLAGSKLPATNKARSHHKKTVAPVATPQVIASQVGTDPTPAASQS